MVTEVGVVGDGVFLLEAEPMATPKHNINMPAPISIFFFI
jgi:hypothetical protein